MPSLAQRVAQRFLIATASQPEIQDEGEFVIEFLPRHRAAVVPVAAKVHAAIKHYQGVGIPIKHKLLIQMDGKGTAKIGGLYTFGTNPPTLKIAPKQYNSPALAGTISHELGHYIHDCVVPGGMHNREIQARYDWALRQKQQVSQTVRDDASTKHQIKEIEAQIKVLQDARHETKPLPPKGKIFDYQWFNANTRQYQPLTAKLVRKSGKNVTLEMIDPPAEYSIRHGLATPRTSEGNLLVTIPALELMFTGVKPGVDDEIKKLEAVRHDLYESFKIRDTARSDEWDTRYETQAQRHVWAPTKYSRKDPLEWFAELCTTHALGHLAKDVEKWLLAVVRTGEAPPEMALT
jgi:hypothetical protein